MAGRPNTSQQLPVYVGGITTTHAKTALVVVSGTTGHSKVTCHSKGKLSGVGAEEFIENIMENKLIHDDVQQIIEAGVANFTSLLIDNAPCHRVKSKHQAVLEREGIAYCKGWPAYSRDLNSIENVWAGMKQKVLSRHYKSLAELN